MDLSTSSLTSSFSSLTFSSQISQQPNTSLSSKQSKSIFIVPILKTPKLVVSATVASPAELENKNLGNYVKSRLSGGFSVPTIIGTGRSKGTIAPLVLQKGNEEVIINYRDAEVPFLSYYLFCKMLGLIFTYHACWSGNFSLTEIKPNDRLHCSKLNV